MATTAQSIRQYPGPPLFSFGFRPFFLFSAVWAAIAVPIWVASMTLGDGTVGGMDGRLWHIHEMLFGYLAGVIAGFLLTAVPNWTGRLPVTGLKLTGLFALWVAGRAAGFLPAPMAVPAAVIDSAFLVVFAAVIWREVLAAKNRRNLPVCLMVSVLAAANIAFHLRDQIPLFGPGGERAAVAVITGLIALIGGRVTPSFTQNWTRAQGIAGGPTAFNRFDAGVLALTAVALVSWVAAPWSSLTGGVMVLAGLANLARLARWRGWLARREALVWILHLGYAWLGLGLILLGLAALVPDAVPFTAGVHALTTGAMGVETLAMMTRATRGHTGRPRVADRSTTAVYLLILAAAVVRVSAPFLTEWTVALLAISATLWALAFAGFVAAYGPMLWRRPL
ncbi:MAG: NnrS family protein [Brevundimonas sp.]|uniref:NnrS family protein n=1 Tax=Brevundimonas sp. TaxID=1871086 RepID=UPI002486E696|nr:NnrS family protein [Brevundimonas sp.]MDI1328096.1 NnrS family protein [Brevundimonas sp.]